MGPHKQEGPEQERRMLHDGCGNRRGSMALRVAGGGLALALLGGFAVQSCAQPQTDAPPSSGQGFRPPWSGWRGPSDRHFMVMMVSHHQGAIAMADLAEERATRPEIRELAASIKVSQQRDIDQMRSWYRQWYGTDLPSWPAGIGWGWHHGEMMGTPVMPGGRRAGGRGATSVEALQQADDFDRAFIELMIPHHQMGVMMATMEFNTTRRAEMRELAAEMIRVQEQEIETMQRWYRSWYP